MTAPAPPLAPVAYAPPEPGRLALDPADLRAQGLDLGPVILLPVVPGRLEPAWMVREAIAALRPSAIAVELAPAREAAFRRAIARLPLLSVVTYASAREHGRPIHFVVEPADPRIEAVRRGLELGLPVHFVDLDNAAYADVPGPLPDPIAAEQVGAATYLRAALAAVAAAPLDADDQARAAAIAADLAALALARAAGAAPILMVCSLHLARPIAHALAAHLTVDAPPPTTLRGRGDPSATVAHLAESSSREVLGELPFLSAAFERARGGAPTEAAGPAAGEVVELFRRRARPAPAAPNPAPPPAEPRLRGRIGLLHAICSAARDRHRRAFDEALRPGTLLHLLRYACRYALTEGALAPDLYQLVVAARGFAGDDYASEVWEVATTYPWQSERPDLPVLEVSLSELHHGVRLLRFRPRVRQRRRLLRALPPRPKERRPGEWAERFGDGLCSYPPEDLAIEGYGDLIRRRTGHLLAEGHARAVPFTASLHDGLDLRETVRRWYEKTLYVRIEQAVRGRAGDVVIVFEDEPLGADDPKYPWHMTWQGEHEGEGDMAIFSTDPFERIVGPGIGRALYGGVLLHKPPGTMFEVWEDEFFRDARTKAEILLLAALDHSTERLIVHVAPAPPRQQLRHLARRMGKQIVHIPIGQLSPITLQKIRVFHVLADPEIRENAHHFIR